MKLSGIFLLNIFFFVVFFTASTSAEVIVEPYGNAIFMEELEEEFVFILANEGEDDVNFEIGLAGNVVINPAEGRDNTGRSVRSTDRPTAPRRDLESRGILIAERCGWRDWDYEQYFQAIDDFEYDRFRTWDEVQDVNFSDYDIMWLGNYESEGWVTLYNQNLERIEEFVDNGGTLYHCSGTNNHVIHPINPGGLVYMGSESQNLCPLQVNPDENWLINYMNENDPFEWVWREGQRLRGQGCAHGWFTQEAIDNIENSDFHQVIALGNPTASPIIVVYGYGRGFVLTSTTVDGYLHNNPADFHWGRTGVGVIRYLDFLANVVTWIEIEPEEGLIEPGGDVDLTISLLAEEMEAGTHYVILEIVLDDPNQPMIQIPIMMSVDAPIFDLFVVVVDEANGEPMRQVNVTTDPYDFRRRTNNNGEVEILSLPSNEYDLYFSRTDYHPQVASFEVGDNDNINLEISMLHSECNFDIEEVVDDLPVDGRSETVVTISNDGNGPLTYTTSKRLFGGANADPWELRVDVPVGALTQDSRIQGVIFDGEDFYLSGSNNRNPVIYVLDSDREIVDQYNQLGNSRYGFRDLAFDGELIWGAGERTIYGFTPDGDEGLSFDSGISPCTNVAWDSDRDILWCSGISTNIFGFDRDGNQIGMVSRHDHQVYGLAYWPDDPDGYQLYVYHTDNEVGDLLIAKYDIENDDAVDVVVLEHEIGGVALGCFITNQYDIYSWVFMGISNFGAEDRVDIRQIDARMDWMDIDPTEGVIEGGEQQGFVITLDATGLPRALFEGEIVFTHDGIGGETILPLALQVSEGGEDEEMVIDLIDGWNISSAFVQPDPDDIIEITSDLVEAGTLLMVKNGLGRFYNPEFNFNNIPGWRVSEGYLIKMDGADQLTLNGEPVPWNQPIQLNASWQIVSYYPRQGVDAVVALSGIVDALLMAKDGEGRFYNPAFGFSNMGDMIPGQGYLMNMDQASELIYTVEEEIAAGSTPNTVQEILPVHLNTGQNMSLLVLTDIPEGEIGVYTNDNPVGSGVIHEGKCGIAIWGDDPTTYEVDGALKGETLEIRHHNGIESHNVKFEIISGDSKYTTNGFQVVRILDVTVSPEQFGIVDAFPNPFNSKSNLTYYLPAALDVNIDLYNLAGRKVSDLFSADIQAGQHTLTIDGMDLSSGVYFVQLQAGGNVFKRKLTLIK